MIYVSLFQTIVAQTKKPYKFIEAVCWIAEARCQRKKDQIHLILFVNFICVDIDAKIIVATRFLIRQQTLSGTLFGHGGS